MKRLFVILGLLLSATVVYAQSNGFAPNGNYTSAFSVTSTSSTKTLPAGAVAVVYNVGSATAYCALGNSSVTATTNNDAVYPNGFMGFTRYNNSTIACITASTTSGTTLNISGGAGIAAGASGGSSSGGGSGGSVTQGTVPWVTAPQPSTSGGLNVYFVQPAASDNHAVIKAGAGQVYKLTITNNSATVNYVRLYNATTGFNGCNSATNIVYQAAIPASTSVGGLSDSWDMGMAFAAGISICVTSGYATTDTTNATASAMSVNIGYK